MVVSQISDEKIGGYASPNISFSSDTANAVLYGAYYSKG